MNPKFEGWIANLSDGTTVFETAPVPGEQSSWQKLLSLLREKNLKITGFQLQRGSVTIHAMPAKGCEGFYQAYDAKRIMFRDEVKLFQGIGSIIEGKVYITWIDDNNQIYSEIRPLESEKIHSTLRS